MFQLSQVYSGRCGSVTTVTAPSGPVCDGGRWLRCDKLRVVLQSSLDWGAHVRVCIRVFVHSVFVFYFQYLGSQQGFMLHGLWANVWWRISVWYSICTNIGTVACMHVASVCSFSLQCECIFEWWKFLVYNKIYHKRGHNTQNYRKLTKDIIRGIKLKVFMIMW